MNAAFDSSRAQARVHRSAPSLAAVALLALITLASCQTRAQHSTDPTAIADRVIQQLGGKQRWDSLRGLLWTFGAEMGGKVRGNPRHHAWDKYTGWQRVEGVNRDGQTYLIISNINDGRGQAWVNGTPIEGDSLKKLIARAKSMWINDSYWFLMPYKLRDPGVTLVYNGEHPAEGVKCDQIALSFANVGETPGDHYWVYVDQATGRVVRWDMVLEGDQPPPRSYTWEGWEQHDGLWFPTAHREIGQSPPDSTVTIFTHDVSTVSAFPDTEFKGLAAK